MALQRVGVQLTAEGAGAFNGALTQASNLTQRFGTVAQGATGGIQKMSVAALALGTALGSLAAQGISKIVEGITGFVSEGFAFNNTLEQATAKLVAFTGSSEAAAEVLEMVRRRAASTPFAFDEMANSAAGLAAVAKSTGQDLEGLIGIAERLAASNPAEGLEGAAFALREAFSGDFVSLQERFNISKDTIARIKEAGISVESFDLILGELGITTGLVTGLAETFQGRLSTFQDSITNLAAALTTPIFEAFKTILMELQPIIDANSEAIAEFLGSIGRGIGENIIGAWGLLRDAVITFQQALAGDWIRDDIIHPFHDVVGIIGTVVGNFGLLGDAFQRLMEGKPIDSYIEAIVRNLSEMLGLDLTNLEFASIVDGISGSIDTALGLIEDFKTGWQSLSESINGFKDTEAGMWIQANLIDPLNTLLKTVETNLPTAWQNLTAQIQYVIDDFNTAGKSTENWDKVLKSVDRVIRALMEAWSTMGSIFGGTTEKIKENNKQMGQSETLGDTLARVFNTLSEILNGYADNVQRVTGMLKGLIAWAQAAAAAIQSAIDMVNQGAGVFGQAADAGTLNGAPKQTGGGAPGMGDTPDTGPGGVVSPIPPVGQTTKAPATGLMSPAASSTTRNNNVVLNITVNGGGANTASQVKDSAIDALRSVGLA